MIINKEKKFAFVHIQKTAGTSITSALRNIPGNLRTNPHDFITKLENPSEYFKFAFVRNPWDRLYSWYNMLIHKGIHNSFSHYILNNSKNFSQFLDCTKVITEFGDQGMKSPYQKSISFNQLDYISDKDKVIVDFVGKFENLNEDFVHITNTLNIKTKLQHANQYPHKNYREYYTDADVEKVAKMYERDIKYFGYSF